MNLRDKGSAENFEALAQAAYMFPGGQSREEALWRTLCCDQTTQIPVQRAPIEYAIAYRVCRKQYEATKVDGHIDMDVFSRSIVPEDLLHYTSFYNTVLRHCMGRNLCVTTEGYLGNVPNGSLKGDKICILFGSAVPFVLRECERGFFKLIGECYIHGIMDGEVMRKRDIETLSPDFEII
jgi:hypothetical protein